MARSDRRTPRQRTRKQGSEQGHAGAPPLTEEQQDALNALTGRTAALAKELRDAQSGGRDALIEALDPLDHEDEAVMVAYAAQLATVRGAEARNAATTTTSDACAALGVLLDFVAAEGV